MRTQLEKIGRNGAWTLSGLVLSLFAVSLSLVRAQSPTPQKSPVQVLEEFCKLDWDGARLTESGWYAASRFFVKPGRPQPPQPYVLEIIANERVDNAPNPWVKLGDKRVQVESYLDALGQIDSLGRFTSVIQAKRLVPFGPSVAQRGPVQFEVSYRLVLTDTYWEFGPNREGPREVKGPLEWRIEGFRFEPNVTIDAAIRYLTKLRDESASAAVRANAEKSIADLGRLKPRWDVR
jgi:hypothetical protein